MKTHQYHDNYFMVHIPVRQNFRHQFEFSLILTDCWLNSVLSYCTKFCEQSLHFVTQLSFLCFFVLMRRTVWITAIPFILLQINFALTKVSMKLFFFVSVVWLKYRIPNSHLTVSELKKLPNTEYWHIVRLIWHAYFFKTIITVLEKEC